MQTKANPSGKTEKPTSISMSLPKSVTVRGYEIKKMPLGAFLQATEALQDLPLRLMAAAFPGEDLGGVLGHLKTLDKDGLVQLLLRGVAAVPAQVIPLFAQLSGIPQESLLQDEAVGLDGLMEMILAWIEVNGLENFMGSVRTLTGKLRALKPAEQAKPTGFNG